MAESKKVVRHTVKVTVPGLERLPGIARDEIIRELFRMGTETQKRVRGVMRKDTGKEQESVKFQVSGHGAGAEMSFTLSVFSTLIQALVDETGAKPHFPPWKKGTKLYGWTLRKGFGQDISKGQRQFIRGRVGRGVGQRLGRGALAEHNKLVEKQIERAAFGIALKQSKRGLPRPGDPLRKPFEVTGTALAGLYNTVIELAVAKGIRIANGF